MTLASQARSQRVFYNYPVQDYQHVRACQSQGTKLSQADARRKPVPATKRAFVGLFLKGPFSFRALSVQLEHLQGVTKQS